MIPSRYQLTLLIIVPKLLAQIAISWRVLQWAKTKPRWIRIVQVLLGSAAAVMVAATLSDFELFGPVFETLPTGLMTVLRAGTSLWTFASMLACLAYCVMALPIEKLSRQVTSPGRRQFLNTVSRAAVAAPFVITAAGALFERTRIEICEFPLAVKGLPKGLDGLRLLQISDIHLSPYLDEATLARVVDMANDLKPSIAFVTGDLITSAGDPLDTCLKHLSRLKSAAGTFGCLGNHEIYAGVEDQAERDGGRLGIQFLRGRSKTLRFGADSLHVAGVDYQPFEKRSSYLAGADALVGRGGYNILLSHNPDVFPVAAKQGFDLTLSGHTHGGQITVEILKQELNPARFLTRFVSGLYRIGNRACYVNRGIGTLGVPVRIGAAPEITLITLTSSA